MTDDTDRPELTVYLRASAPSVARDRQREVIERAERLVETDRIEDVTVRRWDDRVFVSEGHPVTEHHAVEAFETFKEHAEEFDRSVKPFFQEHERDDGRLIVFPVICVAVHVDDELRGVFPSADEDRSNVYSVWDCLTALETDGRIAGLID